MMAPRSHSATRGSCSTSFSAPCPSTPRPKKKLRRSRNLFERVGGLVGDRALNHARRRRADVRLDNLRQRRGAALRIEAHAKPLLRPGECHVEHPQFFALLSLTLSLQ